jgi:hypothetical protein
VSDALSGGGRGGRRASHDGAQQHGHRGHGHGRQQQHGGAGSGFGDGVEGLRRRPAAVPEPELDPSVTVEQQQLVMRILKAKVRLPAAGAGCARGARGIEAPLAAGRVRGCSTAAAAAQDGGLCEALEVGGAQALVRTAPPSSMSSPPQDYYEILAVSRTAEDEDIKRAYRKVLRRGARRRRAGARAGAGRGGGARRSMPRAPPNPHPTPSAPNPCPQPHPAARAEAAPRQEQGAKGGGRLQGGVARVQLPLRRRQARPLRPNGVRVARRGGARGGGLARARRRRRHARRRAVRADGRHVLRI